MEPPCLPHFRGRPPLERWEDLPRSNFLAEIHFDGYLPKLRGPPDRYASYGKYSKKQNGNLKWNFPLSVGPPPLHI